MYVSARHPFRVYPSFLIIHDNIVSFACLTVWLSTFLFIVYHLSFNLSAAVLIDLSDTHLSLMFFKICFWGYSYLKLIVWVWLVSVRFFLVLKWGNLSLRLGIQHSPAIRLQQSSLTWRNHYRFLGQAMLISEEMPCCTRYIYLGFEVHS